MNKFYAIILLLLSFNLYSEEIWFGNVTHHFSDCDTEFCLDTPNGYNQTHESLGYVNDSGIFVFYFKNSYDWDSLAVGKKYTLYDGEIFEPNLKIGLVHGYRDILPNSAYGIGLYSFLGLDINLTDHHTLAIDVVPDKVVSVGYVYKF